MWEMLYQGCCCWREQGVVVIQHSPVQSRCSLSFHPQTTLFYAASRSLNLQKPTLKEKLGASAHADE